MGAFHCPIGAAYYDDDTCIDCGLCYAKNSAEKVEASRKIREYLVIHSPITTRPSKIAICGKGGSGKTMLVTLLAGAMKKGYRVMVLDADESNPGLARLLGIAGEPKPLKELFGTEHDSKKDSLLKRDSFSIADVNPAYISEGSDVSFMLTGKVVDPFQGCACSLAACACEVVEKLKLNDNEVLLLDLEAGVESFGRGVERYTDTVIAVVEPSYESITLAGKIIYMAKGMGIARAGAILNKMTTVAMKLRATSELEKLGVGIYGTISYHADLAEAGFSGDPPDSEKARKEADVILRNILR